MLFGRDAELDLIRALVQVGASSSSPVLMFSGEPGVGKTTLLDAATEISEQAGRTVLRATALEYEADLTYGALNQVLLPLLEHLTSLDDVHRHAIAVICGLEPGPPPTQLIAGAATVSGPYHTPRFCDPLWLPDWAAWSWVLGSPLNAGVPVPRLSYSHSSAKGGSSIHWLGPRRSSS